MLLRHGLGSASRYSPSLLAAILFPRGQEAVQLRVFQDRRLIDRMLQCGKSSVIDSKFGVNLLQICIKSCGDGEGGG